MKWRTTWFGWLVFALLFGCGGAQKVDEGALTKCNEEGAGITGQGAVCEPTKIGLFEIRVKGWEENCKSVVAPDLAEQVSGLLTESIGCTEETRALNVKKEKCKNRVQDLVAKKGCAEMACEEYLTEIKTVISECETLGVAETDLVAAQELKVETEALIAEENLLTALEQLAIQCTEGGILAKKNKTEEALKTMILAFANTPLQDAIESTDAAVVTARTDAFEACRGYLQRTISRHVRSVEKILQRPRVRRNAEEWMSHFRGLEGTSNRLREVGAESIYPEATDAIDKLLLDLDKQKNQIEGKTLGGGKGGAKGAPDAVLSRAPGRCEKLNKDLKRIKGKISQYEQAKNEKKVNAYTKQLKKVEVALEELNSGIAEAMKSTSMDKDKLAEIKTSLESAGCAVDGAPAEAAKAPEAEASETPAEKVDEAPAKETAETPAEPAKETTE